MEGAIRVILADDHESVRTKIRRILERTADIMVAGEAATGEEAVRLAASLAPDVVVMDISMPRGDGLEATRAIKNSSPRTAILILTVHADEEYLFRAIKAGATGYLVKGAPADQLADAIRLVHKGEALVLPPMAARILQEFSEFSAPQHPDLRPDILTTLTAREREVLGLVADGLANKEIAYRLIISERTVKNHMSNIMQKLHANSRTQAAVDAVTQRPPAFGR